MINVPRDPDMDALIKEIWGKAEPVDLHPDLLSSIVKRESGPWIEHQSYVGKYDESENGFYNDLHEQWMTDSAQAIKAKDWNALLQLTEKVFWLKLLPLLKKSDTPERWASAARAMWVESDIFWDRIPEWVAFLNEVRDNNFIMTDEEQAQLREMPDQIKVYRGCRADTINGLSWTIDPNQAEPFKSRAYSHGILVSGTVEKDDIIFFLNGDENEGEVVVLQDTVEIKQA